MLTLVAAVPARAQLSGPYTVGTGGSYATIAAAIADLQAQGVSAPVTFDLLPGVYSEALVINGPIPGASATNRVTFRSQFGDPEDVTIAWQPQGTERAVVDLTSANWVTLSRLTIQRQGSTPYSAIRLDGDPIVGVEILECVITGPGAGGQGILLPLNMGINDSEIRGNVISGFDIGIHILPADLADLRILANSISAVGAVGLWLEPWAGGANALLIANNALDGSGVEVAQGPGSDGLSFYYNTIRVTGYTTAFAQSGTTVPANSVRVRNNILFSEGEGPAVFMDAPSAAAEFDHNLLHSLGTTLVTWGNASHQTLSTLQAASGFHGASVNFHPGIYAGGLVPRLAALADLGVPIPAVTTDRFGQPRSGVSPDLGANEWSGPYTPLAGSFTIGTGGAYPGFAEALADLYRRGVSAPVTFEILDGSYTGRVRLGACGGASPSNRVTFRSQSGNPATVTLSYSPSSGQGVFELVRADYTTLSALTFTGLNPAGYGAGVVIVGSADGARIVGCSFTGVQTYGYGVFASTGAHADSLDVSGNAIAASNIGVFLYNVTGAGMRITRNVIQNSSAGIGVSYPIGPASGSVLVANNVLWGATLSVSQGPSSAGIEIAHNTVVASGNLAAFMLADGGATPGSIRILNNIFVHTGSSTASVIDAPAAVAVSDYNDLYSAGEYLATIGGVNFRRLTEVQAAFGTNEAHSVNTPVAFAGATDPHTTLAALDAKGTPVASVPEDYDGQPRDPATPDIGADEFTAVPGLAGAYTVGAGGDYATLVAAVADLSSKGVVGPTTFDILSGVHVGQVIVAAIPGTSPANRVTFRSQSGDPADVTLQFLTNTSLGVLQLVGTDFVTVSALTLQVTQAAGFGSGILCSGATTDLRLEGCAFTGIIASGSGIRTTSGTHDGLVIRQNSVPQAGTAISLGSGTYVGARVERNLLGVSAQWAIEIANWVGPSTGSIRVANNVVTNGGIYALQAGSGSNGLDILYNSVTRASSGPTLSLAGAGQNNAVRVLNNVLSHTGGLNAYMVSSPAAIAASDHNSLHTSGAFLASWGGLGYASLAALRTVSGKDLASVEGYPGFIDATLHMRSPFLDAAAVPVAEVTEDYDGDPRDPTMPDIGADEFADPYSPLSGTYTVGVGGQYQSLTSAVTELQMRGLSGPVTFDLMSQTFPEQVLCFSPIGVSPTNRVTFRSQTGNAASATVVFGSGNTAVGVFHLAGADYVTISDLTVQVGGSGNGAGVSLSGGTIGVRVQRCVLTGMQTSGYGVTAPIGARADSVEISGNTIAASNRGVYLVSATLTGVRITGNSIRDAVNQGIGVESWSGPATGAVQVANNMLSNAVLRITTLAASNGADIDHNTVFVTTTADALTLAGSGGMSLGTRLRNNVFACAGGGRAMVASVAGAIAMSDHNDLYTSGAVLTQFGGTNAVSLAEHQSLNAVDQNSVSVHPGVLSATDLHTTLAALDGMGAPLASVTTDFDGEPRDPSNPDIGADAFAPGAELAGTFSIGAGGDYPTFAAATAELLRHGVSGPVTFQVTDGTYTERLFLESPAGASPANRVTFESQSGDPTGVTLQFATLSVLQGVVEVLGADWISLRNMSLRVTQVSGLGSCVRMTGASTGASLSGLLLTGLSTNGYGVSVPSGAIDSLDVSRCTVDTGSRGFSFETPALEGVRVSKCTTTNASGISFYLSGWSGPTSGAVLAANNLLSGQVQIRTTSASSTGMSFVNNSVSVTVGTNDAMSVVVAAGTPPDAAVFLQNNVLAAFTGGRALYFNNASLLAGSDHNDLFTSGLVLVSSGAGPGNQFATLAEWQATGREPNSISVHPGYLNVTSDLHTNNSFLDGRGAPLAYVVDDIDGAPRDPGLPDIGADEFTPVAPLAGSFTVGTGGDYTTPTLALSDLYQRGVSAPVTFNLLPGTYSGQWFLQTPAGASPANPVTFQSQSGNPADVTLQATLASNTQGVVELRGADYVTLSGLTLHETSGFASAVLVNGRSSSSRVVGCRFTGMGSATGIGLHLVSNTTAAESLEVRGNTSLTGYANFSSATGVVLVGVRVERNAFNSSGSSGGPIVATSWNGPASGAIHVANNFLSGNGRVMFNQVPTSNGMEFYFNSLGMASNQAALYTGVVSGAPPAGSLRIKNNVLSNSGTGMALQVVNAAAVGDCDYNDLYKPSAGTLANWAGTACATLAALQTASGRDAHSLSGNPTFASATDLHTGAALLAGAGTPVATVMDDYDGEPRHPSAPDIGADETPAAVPLAGTYTVGPTGDYATPGAAAAVLGTNGISAPVSFLIQDGTYDGTTTINAITGANTVNRVRFAPLSGNPANVVLRSTANSALGSDAVLRLIGARYVDVDSITLAGTGGGGGVLALMVQSASHNRFIGCNFNFGSGSRYGLNVNTDTNVDSLVVRECTFTMPAFTTYGVWSFGIGSCNNTVIENNTFNVSGSGAGIYLTPGGLSTGVRIRSNIIVLTGNGTGIRLNRAGGAEISKNRISGAGTGMDLQAIEDSTLVANNFVQALNRGISLQVPESVGLLHNSVNQTGTTGEGLFVAPSLPGAVMLADNVLACPGGGTPLAVNGAPGVMVSSNYNDLYTTGPTVARFDTDNYATLADLRAATGLETNSVSVPPAFVSETDLHTSSPGLNGTGTPLAAVTDDIDGEARSLTTPDIGADEFTAVDGVAPVVVMTGGPSSGSTVSTPTVTFTWSASDNVSLPYAIVSAWTLDGAAPISLPAGTTTVSFDSLAPGPHTFSVTARDEANQTSAPLVTPFTYEVAAPSAATPTAEPITWTWPAVPAAARTWQIEIATTANPDSVVLSEATSQTRFAWSSFFQLAGQNPANSGVTYVARVSATLDAFPGNFGAPSAFSAPVLLDRDAPSLSIVSGPAEGQSYGDSTADFVVAGTDAGVGGVQFAWRLDRGPWSAWQSSTGFTVGGLTPGGHTVQVRATDALGNARTLDCTFDVQGLANLWTADDGAPGYDRAGSSDGTAIGGLVVTDVNGHAGNALDFNGVDALLEVPDSPALYPGAGSFSVGAWVRHPGAGPAFGQRILSRHEAGGALGGTAQAGYEFSLSGGAVRFEVTTPNGFTGSVQGSPLVNDGQWHHLIGVWNRERRYTALYIDGVGVGLQYMDGESPFGSQPLSPIEDEDGAPDPLMLGGSQAAGSTAGENFFTGQLDDVMYVARALDGNQVQSLFLGGALAGCTPIRRNFGADLLAPVAAFTAGPADSALLVGDSTSYAWSATDDATPPDSITFRSALDAAFSGAYTPETSRSLTNLADGVRTFRVEARDGAGNLSAPIARTLRVQRTPPDVAFDSPAAGAFTGANVTIAWHLLARSAISNPDSIRFEARVDSGVFSAPSRDSSLALTGLAEGSHTADVRVTDNVGLTTTRSRAFTVDLTAPTVAFTGGPAEGGYSAPSVTFTFAGTDNLTLVNQLRYSYRLDAGSFTTPSVTASAFFGDLAPGPHTFTVRSHDAAGNVSAELVRQWTVDATPPETQIAGGPADGGVVNTNAVTFDFTGSDNLTPVDSLRFQSRLDGGGYTALATATSRSLTGLTDGAHVFDVRAADLAGLVDATPASRSFTVDAQGPAITIASGPANNACVDTTEVSFAWSATDAVSPPAQIEFSYQLDAAPFTAYGPDTSASFAALAEGLHAFTLQARDGSGHVTSVTRAFRVDVSAPVAAAPTTRVLDSSRIRIQCTATDNSGTTGFRVQVATEPGFAAPVADVQIGAAGTYDYLGVPGASYYARAQAGDCAGNLSAFTGPSNVAVLASLPNLIVTSVTAAPAATSGLPIVVDYTVANNGAGPTSTPAWTERAYLSPTPTFDLPSAVLLGQRQNVTFLGVGESYTGSITGTVPVGTSGTRYVLVVADASDNVPESDGADNTAASGAVAVALGEVADLVVTQVVAPPTALSGDTITVSWTVRNDGSGRTDASQWYDAVFLSSDPTFDFDVLGGGSIRATDDWLGRRQHTGVLEADSSYTTNLQVVLPAYFGGTRYLIVASDMGASADNQAVGERGAVFEDQHEINATAAESTEVTQQLPPDLVVDALTTTGSPISGGVLKVTLKVGNHGFHATGASAWTDQLYLSLDAALDAGDVLLGSIPRSGDVPLDSSYQQVVNVTLPAGISGPRYVIARLDAYGQLVEYLENNNVTPLAQPLAVTLAPWANLVPAGVSVSDTIVAGGSGTAGWQVTNTGTAGATGTWTDNLELGTSPTWTPAARVAGARRASRALAPGEEYAASATFDVPTSYAGPYYVFARSDVLNELFEHTDEGDNVTPIGTVYVKPYPAIDLAVSNVQAPTTGDGGSPLPVTWTVTNQGAGTTLAGWWPEELWLSADPTFSAAQDLQVATPGHSGALTAGGTYTRTVNASVPPGLNGVYYVLVRSDAGGSSGDGSLANNTVASAGTVTITSPAPPQLTVSGVTVAPNLDAGQPALIGWQLNNAGAGAVPNAEWYVGVYLSQDPWLDGSDVALGSVAGPAAFAGGAGAPQQLSPTMPVWASGAYYVIVRADNRGEVWEPGGENDNTATATTLLTLPPPSDLVVTDVVVPPAAVPGEPILVSYSLANQGTNPAVGQLQNAVYMSADSAFVSDDDPLVGVEVVNVNLPPGTSQRFTQRLSARPLQVDLDGQVTALLPALSPGAYHAIVRTNIRDNIREVDGGNNQTVSAAQVQTDLPSLALNVPAAFALANAQAKFYKVDVPADFDLRLTLASDVVDATNEVFVAFGRTPDENEFDFSSPAQFSANPVVLVPQTQAGTYYLLVVSRSLGPVASSENLTLLAETLPFSLTSHAPAVGGAGGRVTVRVRGAGLRDTTEFRLEQSGIVKARAKLARFTNSTDVLARFDLNGVAEGLYDFVAANGVTTVVVPGGFTVEAARPIEVAIETDNADVLRRSATAPFTIRLRNPSNQDAPVVQARVLFPATSALRSLEAGPGLFPASALVPSLPPVTGDQVVLHRTGTGDSLVAVDVVGSDLAPGEVRSLTLGVSGFDSSPYSIRVLADAMTVRSFLERRLAAHEAARRALLADPGGVPPELMALAADAFTFRDTALINTYVNSGVLAAAEVEDHLFAIAHLLPPSPIYPLVTGPSSLLDELAAGGPCGAAGAVPECAPDVAVPGTALPACASVFDADDLPVPTAVGGGRVVRVAGGSAAGFGVTASANARVVVPCDPNLLTGPAGFGTEKWVRASQPMQYRVDFENLPGVASAPAQVVRIVVPIDPNLDPTTFRVGNMGFGGVHQIGVPGGRTSFSAQNGYAELGLAVRVTVGINLATREASWVFTTIDPATGQQPTNPYIGFLPVNDQIGSGTGFAIYSIQPYANAALGSTVQAQAAITFDTNSPVPTNLAANRVDPRAPASAALTGIEVLDATRVRVHWTTDNDSTGAGLANVTLYARQDAGPFSPVSAPVTGSSLEVPVADGHTFGFYTLAADNVGNAEAAKSNPEAAVTLGSPQLGVDGSPPRVTMLHPNFPNPFRGTTNVRFDLARAETVTLDIYDVQGRLVSKPLDGKRLEAGTHTLELSRLPRGAGVYFYRFRAGDYEKTRRMVLIP